MSCGPFLLQNVQQGQCEVEPSMEKVRAWIRHQRRSHSTHPRPTRTTTHRAMAHLPNARRPHRRTQRTRRHQPPPVEQRIKSSGMALLPQRAPRMAAQPPAIGLRIAALLLSRNAGGARDWSLGRRRITHGGNSHCGGCSRNCGAGPKITLIALR